MTTDDDLEQLRAAHEQLQADLEREYVARLSADTDVEGYRHALSEAEAALARVQSLCAELESNAASRGISQRSANQQARIAALIRGALQGGR